MQLEITPLRSHEEVRRDWRHELAQKLGRSEAEIEKQGLKCTDFSGDYSVEIRYRDMTYRFSPYAFVLIRPEQNLAAVFTEHMGYREFILCEGCVVVETHKRSYYHE